MAELRRKFALDDVAADARAAGVHIIARNGVPKFRLQLRPGAKADLAALGHAIGTGPFPDSPRALVNATPAVFWTAPGEWLVTGKPLEAASAALLETLGNQLHAATEMTDGIAVIEISGERSLRLMTTATALDWHAPALAPGHYALTGMHRLPVLVHRMEEGVFRVHAERSTARFLFEWLRQFAGTD